MLNQLLCFTFFPYFLISFSFLFRNKEGKEGKYFRCGGRKKKKKGGGGGGKCVDEERNKVYFAYFILKILYIPVGRVRQHCT